MASRNDVTGDSLINKKLSSEGEKNFEAIFGKRDIRNRPILQEPKSESNGTEQGSLSRYCDCAGEERHGCTCKPINY